MSTSEGVNGRLGKIVTWNEFKQLVDQRLAEQGSDGSIEIDFNVYTTQSTDDCGYVDIDIDVWRRNNDSWAEFTIRN